MSLLRFVSNFYNSPDKFVKHSLFTSYVETILNQNRVWGTNAEPRHYS